MNTRALLFLVAATLTACSGASSNTTHASGSNATWSGSTIVPTVDPGTLAPIRDEESYTIHGSTWTGLANEDAYAGQLMADCTGACEGDAGCLGLEGDTSDACYDQCQLTCADQFDAMRPTMLLARDVGGFLEPVFEVRYSTLCEEDPVALLHRVADTDVLKLSLGCSGGEDARYYEGTAWYVHVKPSGVELLYEGNEMLSAEYYGCVTYEDLEASISDDGTLQISRVTASELSLDEEATCDEIPRNVMETVDVPLR